MAEVDEIFESSEMSSTTSDTDPTYLDMQMAKQRRIESMHHQCPNGNLRAAFAIQQTTTVDELQSDF